MHDQRVGCCPLEISARNRVVTNGVRPANGGTPLPEAMREAVTGADIAFLNTVDHTNDPSFDVAGASVQEIMVATKSGIIDGHTALGEYATRATVAAGADAQTLTTSITALRALLDAGVVQKTTAERGGNFLRIWVMATKRVQVLSRPIQTIDGLNSEIVITAGGTGASANVTRGKMSVQRMTTESDFDMAVYSWSVIAHMYGVMSFDISSHFIYEAVHVLRAKHKESFWTAQEYLINCLDFLDRDICKVHNVTNYDRNIVLEDSRRVGNGFAKAAFDESMCAPVEGGGKVWNGKCQPANSKANLCQAYNRNKAHDNPKHMTSDGTCRFRHLCNHWVTDKGPSGKCMSAEHGWHNCSNPAKCATPLE